MNEVWFQSAQEFIEEATQGWIVVRLPRSAGWKETAVDRKDRNAVEVVLIDRRMVRFAGITPSYHRGIMAHRQELTRKRPGILLRPIEAVGQEAVDEQNDIQRPYSLLSALLRRRQKATQKNRRSIVAPVSVSRQSDRTRARLCLTEASFGPPLRKTREECWIG